MRKTLTGLLAMGVLFQVSAALAAADPAVTCESSKLKISASYSSCRLKADSTAVKKGEPADYTKCEGKFFDKFPDTETKAGPMVCPSEMDVADIGQRITDDAATIATLLAGDVPVECANGVADGDDQCDGGDLDGQTCQGLGHTLGGTLACSVGCGFDTSGCLTEHLPASGQTTSYGAGSDGDVQAGAALSYQDNGDGTITDLNTGLMWEKKIQSTGGFTACTNETGTCADPHNADNAYTWSAAPPALDGRVKTIFLEQLNNRCNLDTTVACTVDADCTVPGGACGFAGHRDWRLPNRKELWNIIDDGSLYDPALNVAFHGASCGVGCSDLADPACSCDASSYYWSATTYATSPSNAWFVNTTVGDTYTNFKTDVLYVRAVRAGS